jgi:hypothetical protein
MSFKKEGYTIIEKAIDSKVANFIYKYLLLKRDVLKTYIETNYITPYDDRHGTFKDPQVPGAFSAYGDIAMDVLLTEVKPIMEKTTGLKLIETYSYTRVYETGQILKKHKDRFSCEISTTLNLGGDHWDIFLKSKNNKDIQVKLKPGDMLVYRGNILEHWREPFKGKLCGQVFLHYNNKATKGSKENKYDGRIHLGLPNDLKSKR